MDHLSFVDALLNNLYISYFGGECEDWSNDCLNVSHTCETCSPVLEGAVGALRHEYLNPYGTNPFLVDIKQCSTLEELLSEIQRYAETQTSLSKSTIESRLRTLRLMADTEKNVYPFDFLNPSYEQFVYHMSWYKDNYYDSVTGSNFYGLKQRKKAFSLFLEACGIPSNYFAYRLPTEPVNDSVDIPNPDRAYDIANFNYSDDKDLNWFWQFAHLYNFIVGPRAPSEMTVMLISDIDFDDNFIKFRQPKLHNKVRKIELPSVFVNGKTRKSLKNFIDYHRCKYVSQYSDDYLFISPSDGKPFQAPNLGRHLALTGKKAYLNFYPYQGRHFCATGTLIRFYLEKHPDPLKATKHYMGHSRVKNTERYTQLSELYFNRYPFDWFKRILKDRNNGRGKCALKSKQSDNDAVSYTFPSRADFDSGRDYSLFIGVILTETAAFFFCFGFCTFSLNRELESLTFRRCS